MDELDMAAMDPIEVADHHNGRLAHSMRLLIGVLGNLEQLSRQANHPVA
jgi:hypothetical protein